MKYLIVKCVELGDQWECDANRFPLCLVNNYAKYNKYGYEIYKIIYPEGKLKRIKNYESEGVKLLHLT